MVSSVQLSKDWVSKDHQNGPVSSANVNFKLHQYISLFLMLKNVCPVLILRSSI